MDELASRDRAGTFSDRSDQGAAGNAITADLEPGPGLGGIRAQVDQRERTIQALRPAGAVDDTDVFSTCAKLLPRISDDKILRILRGCSLNTDQAKQKTADSWSLSADALSLDLRFQI